MKKITTWYNPAADNKKYSRVNLTSLFSWVAVLAVIVMFWSGIAVVYKRDYVSKTIAKVEHKEKKFLANHKALQKKFGGIRSVV